VILGGLMISLLFFLKVIGCKVDVFALGDTEKIVIKGKVLYCISFRNVVVESPLRIINDDDDDQVVWSDYTGYLFYGVEYYENLLNNSDDRDTKSSSKSEVRGNLSSYKDNKPKDGVDLTAINGLFNL